MLAILPSTSSLISESRFLIENGPLLDGDDDDEDDDDDDDQSLELDDSSWRMMESDCNEADTSESADVKRDIMTEAQNASKKVQNTSILKAELRNKIQCRRLSKGVGELKVTFEPPKAYSLTAEEKTKYEKRKQRNRDSANRSRLKRKFQLDYLEKEVEQLTKEHSDLVAKVNGLNKVKALANQILSSHQCKLATATSSTHAQSGGQPDTSANSEEYNRGRAAFLQLSPDQQLNFLRAYAKRCGIQPGTSTNG